MRRFLLVGILVIAAAACGGGGGGGGGLPHGPVVGQNQPNATAQVRIVVPSGGTSSSKRPQFIVAGTQSVAIVVYTVNGATPNPQPTPQVEQISATAPGCSAVSSGISCTFDVGVPISNAVVLEIISYASTDGTGTPLASGFLGPINTTVPITTPVGVSLGGFVSSLVMSPSATSAPVDGTVHTLNITVTAKDANGNTIIPPGNYPSPIALSVASDPNSAISFSPNTIASPSANGTNSVTVTYNSAKTIGATTFIATSGTVTANVAFSPQGSGGGTLTAGYRVFEYNVPTAGSNPWGIAGDGNHSSVWFTENGTSKVGELFTGTCTQTATPTCTIIEGALSQPIGPTGLALGQDGNIWIGGNAPAVTNHVLVMERNGTCSTVTSPNLAGCTQVAQPDPASSPLVADVRAGGDGLVHAAMGTGAVGGGYIESYYPVSLPASQYNICCTYTQPFGLTSTNWFTDSTADYVGQFACTEGCNSSYYPFQAGAVPKGIVAGPDGNLYVANQQAGGDSIVEFSPSTCTSSGLACTTYTNIPLAAGSQPAFLTIGPDGNVWFTESGTSKIGILNISTHVIREITLPTAGAQPWGITLGPDGNVWFTEMSGNKIGVIVP